jgi:hypothetical protein
MAGFSSKKTGQMEGSDAKIRARGGNLWPLLYFRAYYRMVSAKAFVRTTAPLTCISAA